MAAVAVVARTSVWMLMPLLVLVALVLPPYHRHQVVAGGSVVVQALTLICLSALFREGSEACKAVFGTSLASIVDGRPESDLSFLKFLRGREHVLHQACQRAVEERGLSSDTEAAVGILGVGIPMPRGEFDHTQVFQLPAVFKCHAFDIPHVMNPQVITNHGFI